MELWDIRWQPHVVQDFFDDFWVLDGGNDFDLAATFWANLDIDVEHSF